MTCRASGRASRTPARRRPGRPAAPWSPVGRRPWRPRPRPSLARPGAAASAAGRAVGAAAGHPAARRPPAVPAGDARRGTGRWWRPLLGLLLFAVVYLVRRPPWSSCWRAGRPASCPTSRSSTSPTRCVLLVTNLSLIVAIPVRVAGLGRSPHGMGIGWSSSVLGRLRWRLFLPYTLVAAGHPRASASGCRCCVGFLLGEEEVTGPVAVVRLAALVVLLTTPLQSAAEEYLFRGYLSQAIAGWVGRPAVGAVVAARGHRRRCSPLAHAPPDVPTFLDRFAFGLAASAVVWLTGGLEAAIVLHAVNNVLVFVLAGALGEGVATEEVPGGQRAAVPAGQLLAMAAYVAVVARSGAGCGPRRAPRRSTCGRRSCPCRSPAG